MNTVISHRRRSVMIEWLLILVMIAFTVWMTMFFGWWYLALCMIFALGWILSNWFDSRR